VHKSQQPRTLANNTGVMALGEWNEKKQVLLSNYANWEKRNVEKF